MKKLLLTGFEPFLDQHINPTESIVKQLDGVQLGNYQVTSVVLPVDYDRSAVEILHHIKAMEPDAVLSLGLASGRTKITPERVAINVKDGVSDNVGNRPVDEPISKDGNDAYFTTLPIRKMVNALLTKGIPAGISNTAGTYLCNTVMYSVLQYIQESKINIPSGFVHVPPSFELTLKDSSLTGWPIFTIKEGISILIETLD